MRTINTTTNSSTVFTIAPHDAVYNGRVDLALDLFNSGRDINKALATLNTIRGGVTTHIKVEILGGFVLLEKPIILPVNCSLHGDGVEMFALDTMEGTKMIHVPTSSRTLIEGITFIGYAGTGTGILNKGTLQVQNCVFQTLEYGIVSQGLGLRVLNNHFLDNVTGVYNEVGTATITNNYFARNSEYGVHEASRYSIISQNQIIDSGIKSVYEDMMASNTLVVNNVTYIPASLAVLGLEGVVLDTEFDTMEHIYTATTEAVSTALTAIPAHEEHDTVIYIGETLYEGGPIALELGETEIIIQVADQTAYYVTLTRIPFSLSDLSFTDIALVPAFDKLTYDYTAMTEEATSTITATPTDVNYTVTVYLGEVLQEVAPLSLELGDNEVVAKVNDSTEYTTLITRIPVTNLSDLSFTDAVLDPVFSPATFGYTATTTAETTTVTATPTHVEHVITVYVNAVLHESGPIALVVGDTTVVVKVDDTTEYTTVITRTV